MSDTRYGQPPVDVGPVAVEFVELMHWMYLPVKMAGTYGFRYPDNVRFLEPLVDAATHDFFGCYDDGGLRAVRDHYVYLTCRRGWATPDNPINRPGWHTDGFGTDDINYVWCDRWGTRWAVHDFDDISGDHIESMHQFETQARTTGAAEPGRLYRLDQYVVHATPIIPDDGGWRSFVKVSFSTARYDLAGNSHNHLFDYDWTMRDRDDVRNDPWTAGKDHS
ncbi:hypothetical protein [Desertimonas flava]|uniref:hypothetical protein n=1 Tax=Desertimonas flava TaxID=2064846 RepID=UPI0013C52701|nr:hypothetical protein [Desertimonas flava]